MNNYDDGDDDGDDDDDIRRLRLATPLHCYSLRPAASICYILFFHSVAIRWMSPKPNSADKANKDCLP